MPQSAFFTLQLGVVDPRLVERTASDVEGIATWAHSAYPYEVSGLFPRWWGVADLHRGYSWWERDRGPRPLHDSLRDMLESISYAPTFHLIVNGRQVGAALGARAMFTDTDGVRATPAKRLADMVSEYLLAAPREVQDAGYAQFPMTRADAGVRVPRAAEITTGDYEFPAPLRALLSTNRVGGYPTATTQGISTYPFVAVNRYQGTHASSLITKTVTIA